MSYKNDSNEKIINNKNILSQEDFYNNQKKILIDQKKINKKKDIDIIQKFKQKKGINEEKIKTDKIINYIHINSADRDMEPSLILNDNLLVLSTNGFSLTYLNDLILFNIDNHNLLPGDNIVINNIDTTKINLLISSNDQILYFTNNSSYVKISSSFFDNDINVNELSTIDTTNLFIEISGFKGNVINSYFDNLPINIINKLHRIYLSDDNTDTIPNINTIYIKLPLIYYGNEIIEDSYQIQLKLKYICGIPLNKLNANYPINQDRTQGYYKIFDIIDNNNFSIKLSQTSYKTKLNVYNNIINICKINSINQTFLNPNYYILKLDKIYTNVSQIRMINSCFPNTKKLIEKNTNDKLYWQNLNDGDYVYSIQLEEGNYEPSTLVENVNKKINLITRVNYNIDYSNTNVMSYNNNNYIQMAIDTNTNIVSFNSYNLTILSQPIINVSPEIDINSSNLTTVINYFITISHSNHNLNVGSIITINNCLSYKGIPSDILNTIHSIYSIVNKDQYIIKLPQLNLESGRQDNKGGNAVMIYSPNNFRLLFNYSDTFGKILGFRNVGTTKAITEYNTIITNDMLYESEINVNLDSLGNELSSYKNELNFTNDDYLFIYSPIFKNYINVSKIDELYLFYKILLTGDPGSKIFNSFEDTPYIPITPIPQLDALEFYFYDQNNNLYDFNNVDHNFTLEITSLNKKNIHTNINTFTLEEK